MLVGGRKGSEDLGAADDDLGELDGVRADGVEDLLELPDDGDEGFHDGGA